MLSEEQDEIHIFLEQYVKLINMWLGGKFIKNNSSDNLQYAYKIKEQLDLVKQLDSARTLATSTTDDSKAFQNTDYSKNLEEIEDGLSALISVWENEMRHEESINLSNKIRSHGAKPFMTKKIKLMLGSIAAALLSGALNTKTNDMTSSIIKKNQIDPLIQQLQVESSNYVDLPDIGTPSTSGSGEFENIMGTEVVPFEMGTGVVPSNNNVDKYGIPREAQYGNDSSTMTMLPPPQYETFDGVSVRDAKASPYGFTAEIDDKTHYFDPNGEREIRWIDRFNKGDPNTEYYKEVKKYPSYDNSNKGGRRSTRKMRRRSCKKRKSRRKRQSSRRRKSRVSRK
jgi:hypothetical protein